jgi:Tfp pilus assembly protein PilO
MIVSRRPWTLYDVDIVGGASVMLLLLAAVWLVVWPWQRTWREYRHAQTARSEAVKRLEDDRLVLDEFEQSLQPLQQAIASQTRQIPYADSFARLLQQLTDVANEAQLQLLTVQPQPIVESGPYLVSDIHLGGRGRSRDFIRFLDRLAQENPYQSLVTCAVDREAGDSQPACNLSWTVRLYLLPATSNKTGVGL